jgi:hypothetical protein
MSTPTPLPAEPKANPPVTPPADYVTYIYFAFNPTNKHRIYSNDGVTWFDEDGQPVPSQ